MPRVVAENRLPRVRARIDARVEPDAHRVRRGVHDADAARRAIGVGPVGEAGGGCRKRRHHAYGSQEVGGGL